MRIAALLFAVLFGQSLPFGSVGTGTGTPSNPWTVTNNQIGSNAGSANTISAPAFTSPLTNGSLILVGTASAITFSDGLIVSDTAGNTYNVLLTGNQFGPGTPWTFCASNTHVTANNIVTLSHGGFPKSNSVIEAFEIVDNIGSATCANIDDSTGFQNTSGSGADNAFCGDSGGRLNLTHANDFVFAWFNYASASTVSAGTSPRVMTLLNTNSSSNNSLAGYFVQRAIFGTNFSLTTTTSATGQVYQGFCSAFFA